MPKHPLPRCPQHCPGLPIACLLQQQAATSWQPAACAPRFYNPFQGCLKTPQPCSSTMHAYLRSEPPVSHTSGRGAHACCCCTPAQPQNASQTPQHVPRTPARHCCAHCTFWPRGMPSSSSLLSYASLLCALAYCRRARSSSSMSLMGREDTCGSPTPSVRRCSHMLDGVMRDAFLPSTDCSVSVAGPKSSTGRCSAVCSLLRRETAAACAAHRPCNTQPRCLTPKQLQKRAHSERQRLHLLNVFNHPAPIV